MKRIVLVTSLMLALLANLGTAWAQSNPIRYGIRLDANGTTYRVYMTSATLFSGNNARIASAQVTIRVPHGTGTNRFTFNNVQGRDVNGSPMFWSSGLGRADAPKATPAAGSELPYDYISFGYSYSSSPVTFDIPANTDIELFSFTRTSVCTGEVTLFNNDTDPFREPNTLNTTPGNQMTIQALGLVNAYNSNLGSGANCQTAPDLTVAITGTDTPTAGTPANYTITASNIGTGATSGVVSLTTLLPAGLAYNGSTGAAWACTSTTLGTGNVQVVCTSSAAIAGGGSSSYVLQLTPASTLASATFSAAVLTAGEASYTNNTASKSLTVAQGNQTGNIDLTVAVSGPAILTAGVAGSYSATVSNIGTTATSGVISSTLLVPAGFSVANAAGAGWMFSTSAVSGGNTQFIFTNNGPIAGGGSSSFSFQLTAAANIASASFGVSVLTSGESSYSNNTANKNITVAQATAGPNLAVAFSGPASLTAGTAGSYSVAVSNISSGATTGPVTVTFTLPNGLSYTGFSGANWNVMSAMVNGQTVYTATLTGTINGNASANTLILNLLAAANAGGTSGTIMGGANTTGDTNLSNNGFSQSVSFQTAAPATTPTLSGTLTGPANVTIGTASTFALNLSNTGTGATTGPITTTMSLPAGVTYNSFTGPGWTVSSAAQSNGTTLLTATYSGTVAPGAVPSLQIVVTPATIAPGATLTIAGSFTTSGNTNTGSNSFSASATVQSNQPASSPDLTAILSSPGALTVGTPGSLTLVVANIGSGITTNPITTTLLLPAGLAYQSFMGTNWSVTTTTQGNATLLTAVYNALLPAGNTTQPLVLIVNPTTPGTLTINGAVSTPGENNTANNGFSTTQPVQANTGGTPPASQTANLSTTVGMTNQAPNQFESTTAIIIVTNNGPNSATGVASLVTLPAGNPITSVNASGGSFNSTTGQWTIGTLTAGQSVTLSVTLSATTGGIASVGNEITASGQFDPNSTPNNHVAGEDDQAQTCFSVPIELCAGQSFTASIGGTFSAIQWKRNGQNIPNATTNSLTISQSGTYSVVTDVSCPAGGCCPIIVRDAVNCCAPTACIPITIRKTR